MVFLPWLRKRSDGGSSVTIPDHSTAPDLAVEIVYRDLSMKYEDVITSYCARPTTVDKHVWQVVLQQSTTSDILRVDIRHLSTHRLMQLLDKKPMNLNEVMGSATIKSLKAELKSRDRNGIAPSVCAKCLNHSIHWARNSESLCQICGGTTMRWRVEVHKQAPEIVRRRRGKPA